MTARCCQTSWPFRQPCKGATAGWSLREADAPLQPAASGGGGGGGDDDDEEEEAVASVSQEPCAQMHTQPSPV